jgi:hypothetical protein
MDICQEGGGGSKYLEMQKR